MTRPTHIDGLPEVDQDTCYRAMDWLLEIEEPLAEQVYWQVADLLNLEVDLLFFDYPVNPRSGFALARVVGFFSLRLSARISSSSWWRTFAATGHGPELTELTDQALAQLSHDLGASGER